ncbi:MAG: AAA family ATPase [Candidatus Diapherotrites archaeon]|nr:AAA family ATPase [Candidatus Diapherotrites archaeon]
MITSITLQNWRTHKNSTLEFGKGTNVIVGIMGSGKSSVINAISYALFGTFPALQSKQVSLGEIIMARPNKCDNAKVILHFEYGGGNYRIEREISEEKTNYSKLFEDEKLVAGPKQKDVNEAIEKILEINYELFSRAIYAEQNEMDFFLKLSPRERKQKFDELLGLEKYENARKNAVALQNQFAKANKERNSLLKEQKKLHDPKEEAALRKKITADEKELEEIEKKITGAKKEEKMLREKLKTEEEKEKEHKLYSDLLIKTNSKIETLREQIEKSKAISPKEITKKIEKAEKTLEERGKELEGCEKEIEKLENESKKQGEEARVCAYKKKELERELKEIAHLKGKCPTCKRELDDTHKNKLAEEINSKISEISAAGEKYEREAKIFEEKIAKEKKQRRAREEEIKTLRKEFYELEAGQRGAKEAEEKAKQFEALKNEPENLKKEIKKIGFSKEELEKARKAFFEKQSAAELLEEKVSSKKELLKNYGNGLQKIAEMKKLFEETEKKIEKTERAANALGVFGNCLAATQTSLRESLIETVNDATSNIWEKVYPYKDFTNAKLSIEENGYELKVLTRNNEWVRVEGILSGGERSAAAICIRIAFALVLTKKLSMLILDEPTHNLDTNAVETLGKMLREELPRIIDQIFVITHDKQLESAASSNLYTLKRDKNSDGATVIETI